MNKSISQALGQLTSQSVDESVNGFGVSAQMTGSSLEFHTAAPYIVASLDANFGLRYFKDSCAEIGDFSGRGSFAEYESGSGAADLVFSKSLPEMIFYSAINSGMACVNIPYSDSSRGLATQLKTIPQEYRLTISRYSDYGLVATLPVSYRAKGTVSGQSVDVSLEASLHLAGVFELDASNKFYFNIKQVWVDGVADPTGSLPSLANELNKGLAKIFYATEVQRITYYSCNLGIH